MFSPAVYKKWCCYSVTCNKTKLCTYPNWHLCFICHNATKFLTLLSEEYFRKWSIPVVAPRRGSSVVRLLGLRLRIPPGHWCLSPVCVVCCKVEVSGSGWSPTRRSSTEYGVSECDCETSIMRWPWPARGCCTTYKKISGKANRYKCVTVLVLTDNFITRNSYAILEVDKPEHQGSTIWLLCYWSDVIDRIHVVL
jgi:hypothetical protein